jgi:hypothetical protein
VPATVPVNGNKAYTVSTTLPTTGTVAGTYQWSAVYQGDGNNNQAVDLNNSNEQVILSPANPTITTTPGKIVRAGTGQMMTDSATLKGGYFGTGMLTFTLDFPGSTTAPYAYRATVPVSGNGTYSVQFLPSTNSTVDPPGVYQWVVSYSGDANNNPVAGRYGAEPETFVTTSTGSPMPLSFYIGAGGQQALMDPATGDLVASVYNALFGIPGQSYLGQTPTSTGALVLPGSTTLSVLVNASVTYLPLSFFQTYGNVQSYLQTSATTNMANSLSAQLMTAEFNVALGFLPSAEQLDLAPGPWINTWQGNRFGAALLNDMNVWVKSFSTLGLTAPSSQGFIAAQAVVDDAIAMLVNDPKTVVASTARVLEEALKIILDGADNDLAIFAS